jgi:esterase/lipase
MSLPGSRTGSIAPSPRDAPPADLAELDGWLQATEATVTDLRPGTRKGIIWQGADRQRRPWAVVYLHGFSASRLETAPLAEVVGQALGAHVFYARLTGHGRSGQAMAEALPQDWMADTVEALRIGNLLGQRVLLMSCSTGATLATWLGTSALGSQVAAHVFLSPNFGPKDWRGELVNWPWGRRLVLTMAGESRGWVPGSEAEALAWTCRYPTRAVFPMMALVKAVRDSDLASFKAPVQMYFSEQDQTVSPARIKAAFARFGSLQKQLVPVGYSQSKGQHVLAGTIMDPAAVAPMAEGIVKWVRGLAC